MKFRRVKISVTVDDDETVEQTEKRIFAAMANLPHLKDGFADFGFDVESEMVPLPDLSGLTLVKEG
jgi:small-conductance mechanosensitive channel